MVRSVNSVGLGSTSGAGSSACGGCGLSVCGPCSSSSRTGKGATGASGATGSTGAAGATGTDGGSLKYLTFSGSGTGSAFLADSGNGFAATSVAQAYAFGYVLPVPITVHGITVVIHENEGHTVTVHIVDEDGADLITAQTLNGNGTFNLDLTSFTTSEIGVLLTANAGSPIIAVAVGYN